jgi:UDP-glucose 4-epimerase
LIPNILRAALNSEKPVSIFGTDYPTRDGTCLRDYCHVMDIARAHVLALEKLDDLSGRAYNLGNGGGYSVMEVIEAVKKVTGMNISVGFDRRRPGDPAVLVASSNRAKSELGWKPEYVEIEGIIETAWKWMRLYPNGYEQ